MIGVYPIHTRTNCCYLVRENTSWMMIDAGYRNSISRIQKVFDREQVSPATLSLIVVTHVHHDHVGSLRWVKDHSEAPVLVHADEALTMERGEVPVPEGTVWFSRLAALIGRTSLNRMLGYRPVRPDIEVREVMSLHSFGFSATILPTPGHTRGSISVLFGSGEAFVGDSCIHLPLKKSVFPWFANDVPVLMRTWETLLQSEATTFYPGHGKPFSRSELERSYRNVQKRYA